MTTKTDAGLIAEARRKADAGIPLTDEELAAVWEALQPALATFRQIIEAVAASFGQLAGAVDWAAIAKAVEQDEEPQKPLIHNGRKPR